MKKINFYVAALALTMVACTNKEEVGLLAPGSFNTVTAEVAQPVSGTRIAIGENDGKKYPLSWTTRDFLAVFDSEGNSATYRYKNGEGTSAQFARDVAYKEELVDVSYSIANYYSDGIDGQGRFVFNSGEYPSVCSLAGGDMPMYGAWNNELKKLQFYPVLGYLKVKVKPESVKEGDILVWSCDGNHVIGSGVAEIKLEGNDPSTAKLIVTNPEFEDDALNEQHAIREREMMIFDNDGFYIMLPPQNYEYFQMYVKREVDFGTGTKFLSSPVKTIKAKNGTINIEKKIYDLGELDFGAIENPKPVTGSVIEWERVNMNTWEDVTVK